MIKGLPSILIMIVILGAVVRLQFLPFPDFSTEEIRLINRAYFLSQYGVDELGREYPIIFNSRGDYQLPLTTYFASLMRLIIEDNNLAVRVGFILLNLMLIVQVFRLAQQLFGIRDVSLYSAAVTAFFSPLLLFLSPLPGDGLILVNLTLWLVLIISKYDLNLPHFIFGSLLIILTAKEGVILLLLLTFLAAVIFPASKNKRKVLVGIAGILLALVFWWTTQPNGLRSMLENDLTIISDVSLINGINALRGQSQDASLPGFVGALIFNKIWVIILGVTHYLQYLHPGIIFGNLEKYLPGYNFLYQGEFSKVLILPFTLGLIQLIRTWPKFKYFTIVLVILLLPVAFSYPSVKLNYLLLTLPFWAVVIGLGLVHLKGIVRWSVILIALMETLFLLVQRPLANPITDSYRPGRFDQEISSQRFVTPIYVSDNIMDDLIQRLVWIELNQKISIKPVTQISEPLLYKYTQINLGRYTSLLSTDKLVECEDRGTFLLSDSDYQKVIRSNHQVIASFSNNSNRVSGYLIEGSLCLER